MTRSIRESAGGTRDFSSGWSWDSDKPCCHRHISGIPPFLLTGGIPVPFPTLLAIRSPNSYRESVAFEPPRGRTMRPSPAASLDDLQAVIARHWGYRSFRPLQEPATRAVLQGRDSLVVLPTGGGKSLCYQAPAVLRGDTTVVVSPLIALMKDQVDGLQACGVPAVQIDSMQTPEERYAYELDIRQGAIRLLFVSPERLVMPSFQSLLRQINVRTFAIDE